MTALKAVKNTAAAAEIEPKTVKVVDTTPEPEKKDKVRTILDVAKDMDREYKGMQILQKKIDQKQERIDDKMAQAAVYREEQDKIKAEQLKCKELYAKYDKEMDEMRSKPIMDEKPTPRAEVKQA